MSNETKRIEAPNLIEFINEIQASVQEGYVVTDTNEGIPQSWGPGLYTCEMVSAKQDSAPEPKQSEPEPVVEENTNTETEDTSTEEEETKPAPKTTRKPRRKSTK